MSNQGSHLANWKKIKKLRMDRQISLSSLSRKSGVSKAYLSLLERGKVNNPSLRIVLKIAEALEIDINKLVKSSCTKYK